MAVALRYFTHDGRCMSVSQWAKHLGLSKSTMDSRIKYGFTGEKLFAPAAMNRKGELRKKRSTNVQESH